MAVKLSTALSIAEKSISTYLREPDPDNMPRFMFWGKPGMGKSAGIAALGRALQLEVQTLILAHYDAADIGGITFIVDGTTRKMKPFWWPKEGTQGILFLDELPASAQMNQNIIAQLVCERRIGEFPLPVGWSIIAAGNRRTDRAATSEMPMHVRNRFAHYDVEEDLSSWIADFAHQKNSLGQTNITGETIAYLTSRPAHFCKFEPLKNENAWPSPRSWTYADKIFRMGLSEKDERIALEAYLGSTVAQERMDFRRLAKRMPKPAHIYQDPTGTAIPSDAPDVMDALLNILVDRAAHSNIAPTCIYINRLPREIGNKFIQAIKAKKGDLLKTAEMVKLVADVSNKPA